MNWPKLNVKSFILFFLFLATMNAYANQNLTKINEFTSMALPSSKIQILIWNIYAGKKANFPTDFEQLDGQYHIVALQEANLNSTIQKALNESEKGWQHATSFKTFRGIKMGVATGSSVKPLTSIALRSKNREVGFTTRKTSLIQKFKIQNSNKELMLVNVHAINFQTTATFKEEVDYILEQTKSHHGPLIIGGDFNAWNEGRAKALVQKMTSAGLEEVPFAGKRMTSPFNANLPLDRVFIKDLTVDSSLTLEQIDSSDHIPLVITISI